MTANGQSASVSPPPSRSPTCGSAPYPAIIGYGGVAPLDTTVIDSRGRGHRSPSIRCPSGAEGQRARSHIKREAFYSLYPGGSQTGLLVAWALGVSRIVDVIAQSDGTILRADAVGVSGCSRFGKGAFIAGAFDQQIALTMPVESGTAGVPIWRGIAEALVGANGNPSRSLSSAYNEQPWFARWVQPVPQRPDDEPHRTPRTRS